MTMLNRARAFMPKDQFDLHINMTPTELRIVTHRLMAAFATSEVEAAVNTDREKIATELEDICDSTAGLDDLFPKVRAFIDRLRSNK